ncbi:MAG TPA: hypothetical protein VNF74_09190 [Terriglobales bacterium]|nr:hypothetical protein [Terriglobales bacterium]
MALLRRTLAAGHLPAGILANREQAAAALLRMLSRARRRREALLLVCMRSRPASAVAELGHERFLAGLAAEVRISDLVWREPAGMILLLLEGTAQARPVLARLEHRAQLAGTRPEWRSAAFPEQGLTLQALLEAVA